MPADLAFASAAELIELYRSRRASPVEATEAALARIERHDPALNAFVLVDRDGALRAARASEARWRRGAPLGLLEGVPATVKDLLLTRGWPTRRGSRAVPVDRPCEEDAPAVARLRVHGAVLLGKTTTPEFGWKGVTDSALTGTTRNPWNPALTPGGSSGGAAVAAATGMGALHLGSDGGGSIRIPAAFTGIFGLKPSFGRVPVWPYGPFGTLGHVGPLARSVADAALLLTAIAEPDPRDPLALLDPARDWRQGIEAGVAGLKIAYAPSYAGHAVEKEVARLVAEAVAALGEMGARIEPVELPLDDAWRMFRTLWFAGAAKLLQRVPPEARPLVDPGFLAVADIGAAVTLSEYFDAEAARRDLASRLSRLLAAHDLLAMPTMPMAAFAVGHDSAPGPDGRPRDDWSPFTYPFNMSGQPAASAPVGLTADGRPVGLQLVAARARDDLVLRASRALERWRPFRLPPL